MPRRIFTAFLIAYGALTAIGLADNPASVPAYLAFHAAFFAVACLAVPAPRRYSYTVLAAFLLLGFQTKLWAHLIAGAELIESTGFFDGSRLAWDRALWTATMGALGLACARAIDISLNRRRPEPPVHPAPSWYVRFRRPLWTVAVVVTVGAALLNAYFGIWRVGDNQAFVLPFPFHAMANWWYALAAAMIIALLVDFERRHAGTDHAAAGIWLPVLEGVVTSTSMLSRGQYVMRVLPYVAVEWHRWLRTSRLPRVAPLLAFVALTAVGLGVTVVTVSWLRLSIYPHVRSAEALALSRAGQAAGAPDDAPRFGMPSRRQVTFIAKEIGELFVGRWIGLEGVLAATAYEKRSPTLLRDALREDPKKGNDSIYQEIARHPYPTLEGFTFLTVPGAMGVLSYAGLPLLVFAGMGIVAFVMMTTEAVARWATDSELLAAVVAVGTANVVVQMNFPYLTMVFFLELWVTLAALALVLRSAKGARLVATRKPRSFSPA